MVNIKRIYSQFDSQWSNVLLGFNTNPKFNIYNYGCLITVQAMVATYFGHEENPLSINNKYKMIGGFQAGSGLYVHGKFSQLFPNIKEKITRTPQPLSDSQMGEIRGALQSGYPVMLYIDANPKTVKPDQHFVLAVDIKSDENDITIVDPLGGKVRSLKDYLGWFRPSARKSIEAYFIYEGQVLQDAPSVGSPAGGIDAPQVRDMLVAKATEYDRVSDFFGLREEDRIKYEAGNLIIGEYRRVSEELSRAYSKLDSVTGYTTVPVAGGSENIPTEQDKNVLFKDIGEIINGFLNKFKK